MTREQIREQLDEQIAALVGAFDSGSLGAEDYLTRVNACLKSAMVKLEDAIGSEQFLAEFGEAGRHPDGLIDREIFLRAHS